MAQESNLSQMLRAIDLKQRDYWDNLSDEQKKKHSSFLSFRWACTVAPSGAMAKLIEQYYIQNANATVNKNYYDLSKHPKLQWLLLTCISPGTGNFRHEWVPFKGKAAKNKRAQLIADLFPAMKLQEAEMLANTVTNEELKSYLIDLGWEDKKIKEAMKGKDDDN